MELHYLAKAPKTFGINVSLKTSILDLVTKINLKATYSLSGDFARHFI